MNSTSYLKVINGLNRYCLIGECKCNRNKLNKKKDFMKKFTLILIMLITSLFSVFAQNRRIVLDKTDDNVRVIEAQGTKIGGFTATKILFIGLQTWVSPQDTTQVMVTNVNTLSPMGAFDDAIMLIKTMDDEVLELYCVTSDNNFTNINYGSPTITTTKWRNRLTSTYNSNSVNVSRNINYWHTTPSMIEKLKVGVKKIKIQYLKGVYEKEFKKDEIGKILYDSFLSEIKHINGDKNKDFKKDF